MRQYILGITNFKRLYIFLCIYIICGILPSNGGSFYMDNPLDAGSYPETTINKIRYWGYHHGFTDHNRILSIILERRFSGFVDTKRVVKVNGQTEKIFIDPEGKEMVCFSCEAYVVSPIKKNVDPPYYDETAYPYYVGDIIIPDSISTNTDWAGTYGYCYVFGIETDCFNGELSSIRTPKYARIVKNNFKGALNLNKVQIGACYEVYPYGFKNCKKLETVIFERGPYVYDLAFRDCTDIKTIVLTNKIPMLQSDKVFEETVYSGATLYVPDGMIHLCKRDPVWGKFTNVKSILDLPSGVIMPQSVSN